MTHTKISTFQQSMSNKQSLKPVRFEIDSLWKEVYLVLVRRLSIAVGEGKFVSGLVIADLVFSGRSLSIMIQVVHG